MQLKSLSNLSILEVSTKVCEILADFTALEAVLVAFKDTVIGRSQSMETAKAAKRWASFAVNHQSLLMLRFNSKNWLPVVLLTGSSCFGWIKSLDVTWQPLLKGLDGRYHSQSDDISMVDYSFFEIQFLAELLNSNYTCSSVELGTLQPSQLNQLQVALQGRKGSYLPLPFKFESGRFSRGESMILSC